mmetsp:Transcript_19234/g.53845  ORF Transcript_19234/g.53845 Transcript_19234/m.53845 type:complete len:268 (-) Transcript_19234:607-1410(-)
MRAQFAQPAMHALMFPGGAWHKSCPRGYAMNTMKKIRKNRRTPKTLSTSQRLEEMVLRYLSSCAWALVTLDRVSSMFSSMRMAISPCCDTISDSLLKIPPSSTIVDSTLCSASARLDMYVSCGADSVSCCCCCCRKLGTGGWNCCCWLCCCRAAAWEEEAEAGSPAAVLLLCHCCWERSRGRAASASAPGPAENSWRRSLWCFKLSVRTVSTSLNSWVASLSLLRKLSTTVWEWSWLCLLVSFRPFADRRCRSTREVLSSWMSCFIM